ncbi:hypothetical protein F4677DRAFT_442705 [Hypoxylon crocopeplum]|nr:hypothetical protein F4677DRAFT_442705 [Hypoxylon crocopeplum]
MVLTTSEEGKDLLEGDFFKDATVECGSRAWEVHKLVVCSRSEWFKKAFCGGFDESKTGKVTIREQDPTHVDWVIYWIYTRELLDKDFKNVNLVYEACIDLYNIADFFCLRDLQEEAKSHFQKTMPEAVTYMMRYVIPGKENLGNPEEVSSHLADFFAGVESAYKNNYDWAKSEFIGLVAQTNYWVFCNDTFRSLCKDIPAFYQDLVEKFVEAGTRPSWCPKPPMDCRYCSRLDENKSDSASGEGSGDDKLQEEGKDDGNEEVYWTKFVMKRSRLYAICNYCVKKYAGKPIYFLDSE